MHKTAVALMARYPALGEVKTRLAAEIGPERTLMVYRQLLTHAARTTCDLDPRRFLRTAFVTPGERVHDFGHMFFDFDSRHEQLGDDLGERMLNAIKKLLRKENITAAILIGSDIPEISPELIAKASDLLDSCDVVLGPTADGGYYLIGVKKPLPMLFQGIDWGTNRVLEQTLAIAGSERLSACLLPELADLDSLNDIRLFPGYERFLDGKL